MPHDATLQQAARMLNRPLTPTEEQTFRCFAHAELTDQDGTVLMTAGPAPAPPAPPLNITIHDAHPFPAVRRLADSGTIIRVHTWSRWERIQWASAFLLIGLLVGALITTAVVIYQDHIQPREAR